MTIYSFTLFIKKKKTIMEKRIRLTESDLHRIIKESVKKILKEIEEIPHTRTTRGNGNS